MTEQAVAQWNAVEGYIGPAEYGLLAAFGARAQQGIVEIGSYRGRSTIALASQARVPVWAIDPHESYMSDEGVWFQGGKDRRCFLENILQADVAERVHLINLPSLKVAQVWDLPIDVLWIDGNHREMMVRQDVREWAKFLVPGGHLLMHDPHLASVQAAMDSLKVNEFHRLPSDVSIAMFERDDAGY